MGHGVVYQYPQPTDAMVLLHHYNGFMAFLDLYICTYQNWNEVLVSLAGWSLVFGPQCHPMAAYEVSLISAISLNLRVQGCHRDLNVKVLA